MAETNVNARLEAFCDGVFAIALTLLIIDIKVPPSSTLATTKDLWRALGQLVPSLLVFLLSFAVILITLVNHHATLKLVDRASPPFIYANGCLLLGVVFIPFPTALLGEYLLTDHSAPAVILYAAVFGFQGLGWNLLTRAALKPRALTRDEKSAQAMRKRHRYSYFAMTIYAACAIAAVWVPHTVAIVLGLIWTVWIVLSINTRDE